MNKVLGESDNCLQESLGGVRKSWPKDWWKVWRFTGFGLVVLIFPGLGAEKRL